MRFVFSRKFFILFGIGFIPLSLSWNFSALRFFVLIYDTALVIIALVDYFISRKLPAELFLTRKFSRRFAIGDETEVCIHIENESPHNFHLNFKDEFPPELKLSASRQAKFTVAGQTAADFFTG